MLGRLRLRRWWRAGAARAAVPAESPSEPSEDTAGDWDAVVSALEALLFRHDPLGLDFGGNTDEYRPEAEAIALRRDEVRSLDDAQRVVHEEFVRWFDADTAGPRERYADIARELWLSWRAGPQ